VNELVPRKYPRRDASFAVVYEVGGETFHERATTIGGGGLFITTANPLPDGIEIALSFRPAKHFPLIKAKARVCYIVPNAGMGVEFTDIAESTRQSLLRWIHNRNGAEQRMHPRVPLVAQVESAQFTKLAFAKDISLGGMFIETKEMLPLRTPVNLKFYLQEGGDIVTARGELAYCVDKMGMGVQFTYVSPDDADRIKDYVAGSIEKTLVN
jgi:c-di-GMP-binding flagellar brake protein YcgR